LGNFAKQVIHATWLTAKAKTVSDLAQELLIRN
jgi:hypothetical protein